jgi:hypothetical protein
MWHEVHKHGFFLTFAVEKKLYVFVKVTPFLGFLGLLGILAGQISDNLR